jgi:DNA polymerase-1
VVVALGTDALLSLTGERSILRARGGQYRLWHGKERPVVMPTLHPAFMAEGRSPKFYGVYLIDWARIGRALQGTLRWNPGPMVLEPDLATIRSWVRKLAPDDPVAVDVETAGRSRFAPCVMVCLSARHGTVVVPWAEYTGDGQGRRPAWSWKDEQEVKALVQQVFDRAPLTMHNGQYDTTNLEHNLGFKVAEQFATNGLDTMAMQHVLNPELPKTLGDVTSYYTDSPKWKDMVDYGVKSRGRVWELNFRKYNGLDGANTRLVRPHLQKALDAEALIHPRLPQVLKDTMFDQECARRMTLRGVPVDVAAAEEMIVEWKQKLFDAEASFHAVAGAVNPASPVQLARLFYDDLGVAPPKSDDDLGDENAEPNRTTDKHALAAMLHDPDPQVRCVAGALLTYRSVSKTLSTYLIPAVESGGRIHCNWNVCGSGRKAHDSGNAPKTGRWSSSEPNLTNIPKWLRKLYRAPKGKVLVAADYKQVEFRGKVYWCRCKWAEELLSAGDPYNRMAADLFVKQLQPGEQPSSTMRTLLKNFVYGHVLYGGTIDTVFDLIQAKTDKDGHPLFPGASRLALVKLSKEFAQRGPELLAHNKYLIETTKAQGWFEEPLSGRVYHYLDGLDPTKMVNQPIQGMGSTVTVRAIRAVEKHPLLAGTLILMVHDQLVLEAPKRQAKRYEEALIECMEQEHDLLGRKVSFPVDPGVGESWDVI